MKLIEKLNLNFFKKINFKKLKKNEFIIYAIALMLVTAGYFNYKSNLEENVIDTYVGEEDYANVGDARLVNSNDTVENSNTQSELSETNNEHVEEADEKIVKEEKKDENVKESSEEKEDLKEENKNEETKEIINEENTKETDETNDNENDYFVNSKLDRDKNYASMISNYTNIVEDSNVSQTEKAIAMKEITKINDTKNAISICENLITTKGFSNCLIFVNNDSVNVVVEVNEKLTSAQVAQIQNIISREFECKIENIHITEK